MANSIFCSSFSLNQTDGVCRPSGKHCSVPSLFSHPPISALSFWHFVGCFRAQHRCSESINWAAIKSILIAACTLLPIQFQCGWIISGLGWSCSAHRPWMQTWGSFYLNNNSIHSYKKSVHSRAGIDRMGLISGQTLQICTVQKSPFQNSVFSHIKHIWMQIKV